MLLAMPTASTLTTIITWNGAIHDDTHTNRSWLLLFTFKKSFMTSQSEAQHTIIPLQFLLPFYNQFKWSQQQIFLSFLFIHLFCHPQWQNSLLIILHNINNNTHLFWICLMMWEQTNKLHKPTTFLFLLLLPYYYNNAIYEWCETLIQPN